MTAPLDIRPLAREDRAAWTPLWQAYLGFYDTAVTDEVMDTTFARYTDPDRTDMLGFLALQDDRAVGLAHVIVHSHGWRIEPVTYMQDLYAIPEARGTGVGRALIEAVYADADAAGRPAVYWMTQEDNATARLLYDRIGRLTPFIKYDRGAA
ncbi:GNAT family N-acetyltransferase [Rhodobacterales bacterium HKCCE3408]|nr:GNAT family N-acetyltransferase [Rhodobacterales bacterium HKCCE3408]